MYMYVEKRVSAVERHLTIVRQYDVWIFNTNTRTNQYHELNHRPIPSPISEAAAPTFFASTYTTWKQQ